MKKIFRTICAAAVALAVLASCDQENIKATYSPEQENEVSFAAGVYTNTTLPITADTVNIMITRSNANGALTVPLSNTMPAGITVPSTVEFADGEYQANVVIGLDLQVATPYKGTISISDETLYNPNVSMYPSISVSLQADYTWVSLGEGQWWCNMITHPKIVSVQVYEAIDSPTPLYRIMKPFTDEVLQAFANVQGGKIDNTNRSEYIEFTHVTDETGTVTDYISFDTFYPGVSIAAAGEEGPVQGVYSADYAKYCGLVEDFIYQFYPYYQFTLPSGDTYSWGQAYPAYLVLPGGPDLGEWLGL